MKHTLWCQNDFKVHGASIGTPARPCTPGGAVAEVAAAAVVCDVNTHTGPVRVDTMCAPFDPNRKHMLA